MKYIFRWLACLLFSLTACAGEAPTAANPATAVACEESDFTSFWNRFVDDREFQQRNTKSPLQKLVIDAFADPSPKPVESSFSPSTTDFPLLPGPAQIQALGLTTKFEQTARGMKVLVEKPDTDYQIAYLFDHEPCWSLVRIENWSL